MERRAIHLAALPALGRRRESLRRRVAVERAHHQAQASEMTVWLCRAYANPPSRGPFAISFENALDLLVHRFIDAPASLVGIKPEERAPYAFSKRDDRLKAGHEPLDLAIVK